MPISTITVAGNAVTLVPMPTSSVPMMIEPWVSDTVASISFMFTGQTQTQGASGADLSGLKLSYAPLQRAQAAPLRAWLKQMRGMSRATQMAPADYPGPLGTPVGSPVVSGAQSAMSTSLVTSGWDPGAAGVLFPDDYIQIGYRLYQALDMVDADSDGNATFEIFPSLRDDLADGTEVVTDNPVGLYRLADNKRNWSVRIGNMTDLSFALVEYR